MTVADRVSGFAQAQLLGLCHVALECFGASSPPSCNQRQTRVAAMKLRALALGSLVALATVVCAEADANVTAAAPVAELAAKVNGTASTVAAHPTSSSSAPVAATSAAVANATTSGPPTPTTANQVESTGTAEPGTVANITADTTDGGCMVNNTLSNNQQAGWTADMITTCCSSDVDSTCWYRLQSQISAEEACTIPDCVPLMANDQPNMAGFRPLSGTNGKGRFANSFPILILSGAGRPAVQLFVMTMVPVAVSLVLLL